MRLVIGKGNDLANRLVIGRLVRLVFGRLVRLVAGEVGIW